MTSENPITFTAPCYIVFNVTKHCCAMSSLGHLAIFVTKNIAEQAAKATEEYTGDKMTVLTIQINCLDEIPL